MNNLIENSILGIMLSAGCVCSIANADQTPVELEPTRAQVNHVAHIYFNVSSGERVITLLQSDQTQAAQAGQGGDSGPIWSSLTGNQCADLSGLTTSFFFIVDTVYASSTLSTGTTVVDWGDIELDTVVDCVHVDWITNHTDTDSDSDGIGDGVYGLGGQWTFFDADNGRSFNQSTRLPVVSLILTNLPGDVSGTSMSDPINVFTGYTADIDLASSLGGASLVFEFGDSDGNLQGAAFGNNDVDTDGDGIGDGVSVANADRDMDGNPDGDLDGDGLFDWSWGVRFYQPGSRDFDGDGTLDGNGLDSAPIGVGLGAPEGEAVQNNDGSWVWEIDTSAVAAGRGQEDLLALYRDDTHLGTFNLGSFSCDANKMGSWTPLAMLAQRLYGPSGGNQGGCSAADIAEPLGSVNFFDVSAFITAFASQDPIADLAEPFGVFNFFDVSVFLSEFAAGCP